MPFLPFAATVGGWLGATGATAAAVGGTAIAAGLGTAAAVGSTISSAKKASNESKKAQETATAQNAAAIQNLKDQQAQASTAAMQSITKRKKAMTPTIFTSPLGLSGTATTAKKSLLGQ